LTPGTLLATVSAFSFCSADSTVPLVLRDQTRLHLGLDPGIRPRIDGRASGDHRNGEDHDEEADGAG
jgi:hypothetical protein